MPRAPTSPTSRSTSSTTAPISPTPRRCSGCRRRSSSPAMPRPAGRSPSRASLPGSPTSPPPTGPSMCPDSRRLARACLPERSGWRRSSPARTRARPPAGGASSARRPRRCSIPPRPRPRFSRPVRGCAFARCARWRRARSRRARGSIGMLRGAPARRPLRRRAWRRPARRSASTRPHPRPCRTSAARAVPVSGSRGRGHSIAACCASRTGCSAMRRMRRRSRSPSAVSRRRRCATCGS